MKNDIDEIKEEDNLIENIYKIKFMSYKNKIDLILC